MSDPDKRSSTADEDETKRIDSTSSSSSSHASSSQIEDVETDPHHGLTRHSTQEDHLAPITAAASRHASRATTTSQLSHSLSRRATNIGTNVTTDPGYEIDWDDDDPENPRNWPLWYKGFAIGTASWSTWVVVLYSTSYTAGIEQMMEEFNITNEAIVTLGVTTYLLGLAIGGVVVAPISETIGRRMTYVVTMFFFLIMVIPCGLATSLEEVIIVRLFGAIAASSMVTLAPGTVADIVDEQHRALAFSIWSLGPLNGPGKLRTSDLSRLVEVKTNLRSVWSDYWRFHHRIPWMALDELDRDDAGWRSMGPSLHPKGDLYSSPFAEPRGETA